MRAGRWGSTRSRVGQGSGICLLGGIGFGRQLWDIQRKSLRQLTSRARLLRESLRSSLRVGARSALPLELAQTGYFYDGRRAHLVEGGLLGHLGGDLVSTPGKAEYALHGGYGGLEETDYWCAMGERIM